MMSQMLGLQRIIILINPYVHMYLEESVLWIRGVERGEVEAGVKNSPGSAADLGSDEKVIWELREKHKHYNRSLVIISLPINQT